MMTRIWWLGIGVLAFVCFGSTEGTDLGKAGSSRAQAEEAQLPAHLRWAREHVTSRPPPEVRRALRPEDKAWLMREYRRQPTLDARIACSWLLAYIGDDEVFRLFSETLRLGRGIRGSRQIDQSELRGMDERLYGMGVMAQ